MEHKTTFARIEALFANAATRPSFDLEAKTVILTTDIPPNGNVDGKINSLAAKFDLPKDTFIPERSIDKNTGAERMVITWAVALDHPHAQSALFNRLEDYIRASRWQVDRSSADIAHYNDGNGDSGVREMINLAREYRLISEANAETLGKAIGYTLADHPTDEIARVSSGGTILSSPSRDL